MASLYVEHLLEHLEEKDNVPVSGGPRGWGPNILPVVSRVAVTSVMTASVMMTTSMTSLVTVTAVITVSTSISRTENKKVN